MTKLQLIYDLARCRAAMREAERANCGFKGLPDHAHTIAGVWDDEARKRCKKCRRWNRAMGRKPAKVKKGTR